MYHPAPAGRRNAPRQLCAAPAVAGFRPGTIALALSAAFCGPAVAQPTGGVAIHGTASYSSQGNRLVVTTQNGAGTRHSAINWQSFSIPAGQVTQFVQPGATSTSINRVVTNNPSQIFGTLTSNGRLVLVNPAGIAVGAGAVVDTAGFTASTLRMSDADAIAGRLAFGDGGTAGALRVDGHILARSGDVVLLAPSVEAGAGALIQSPGGATLLAAGRRVELTGRGLEGIHLQLQAPADQAVNLGTLQGDAVGLFAGTLKHSGLIVASALTADGGKVMLRGQDLADVNGTVQARRGTLGGQVHVTASQVKLRSGAVIDVSGPAGGGEALVGGGWQGQDARLVNAQATVLEAGSTVRANATEAGNGGTVVAWADGSLHMAGRIEAKGGANGGDGGKVETSGKKRLVFRGQIDTSAPRGTGGTVLLDPQDIIIANGADASGDGALADGAVDSRDADASTDVTISEGALENNAIIGSSITLQASRDVIFRDLADDLLDLSRLAAGQSFVVQAGRSIVGEDGRDRIRTNGGGIDFSTSNGTINLGGVLTRGGSVSMTAGGAAGGIQLGEVNTTPADSGDGGLVSLVSNGTGGVKLGTMDARFAGTGRNGNVIIDSAAGAVTVTDRIHADTLQVIAGGGIGDGGSGAAATEVSTLNAINHGSGDILIANSGALAIADVGSVGYGVRQGDGSGRIVVGTTGGTLDVTAAVQAQGGDISLTGNGAGTRVIGSTVDAAGGNVTIAGNGSSSYHAVEIVNNGATRAAVKTSGTGSITINGTLSGGGFSAGSGPGAAGVAITSSDITAGSGPITVNGMVTSGVNVKSRGFLLDSGAVVASAGNINLIGETRSLYLGSPPGMGGYVANGATVSSAGGAVLLRGSFNNPSASSGIGLGVAGRVQSTGAGSVRFEGQASVGPSAGMAVEIANTAVVDAGTLGFTVTATTSSSTTATAIIGLAVNGGTITSAGNVAMTGAIAAPSASGQGAVYLAGGSIQATGAAGITITGNGVPPPAPASARDIAVMGTSLSTAGGQLKLVGDRIEIGSFVNSGTGDTVLTPLLNNRSITLGGTDETLALNLSNSELGLITAGRIVIGSATHTGGISIGTNGGPITLGAAKPLSLLTAGSITQTGAFNIARLHAQAATVNLDNIANQLGIASGRANSGGFTLRGGTPFEVGSAAGTAGITGASGNAVTVQSNGLLTVSSSIIAPTGTLTLQGSGITLAAGAVVAGGTVSLDAGNFGALALGNGNLNATGNMTLANATSATLGNVTAGGTLAINGIGGAVTQAAGTVLDAGTLNGSGNSGNITLANGSNSIGALGALATTGGLTVSDSTGDLAINGPVSGGSGPVLVTAAGSILQSQTVSSNAPGDAVVLAAGANYSNAAGSNALQAPNGRWLVYSATPGANTFGGLLSGNNAIWNATYAGMPPASVAAGNRYVFAFQPTVNVTADARTRVYDGSTGFGTLTYASTPLVDASAYGGAFLQDTFTGALGLSSTSRNVGTYTIVRDTLDVPGYALNYTAANADITPAALTLAAMTDTRVYNGGTGSAQAVGVSGLVGGDTIDSLTQSFTERHVRGTNGSTLQVDAGYVVNDGNGGANYTVGTSTATGTITKASLALAATTDTRVYNGGTGSAQAVGVSGLVGGDTIGSLTQSFTERHVRGTNGSTLQVDVGYVVNDGNSGGNYAVSTSTAAGTITKASLALNAVTDTRVYDGGTGSAQAVGVSGLVGGDTVGSLTQSFTERHVRGTNGSTLQVDTGYGVNDGNSGGNYAVTTNTTAGTITQASLALNAVSDTRVYNGGTGSAQAVDVSGLAGGDTVGSLTQSFTERHVRGANGSTLQVDVGYVVNDGNGGGNYAVTTNTATGTITKASLALNASTDTRVYDGGTSSSQAVGTSGLVGGDTVGSLSQSFIEKHVRGANGSTLQVDLGYVVNDGNGGGNYDVTRNTATGTITKASLALSAAADSRVYDGGTLSSQAVSVSGLVGGDTIGSLTQSFADKHVRGTNGSTLQVDGGYTIADGNGGGNYAVTKNTASGTITPASLSLNAVSDSRAYDGSTQSGRAVATGGLVGGDTIASLTQSFTERHVRGANGSTLQVDGTYVVNDGNGGANYTVTTGTASGTITPARVALSVNDISRVYDGSTAASGAAVVQGGSLFAPDSLSGGTFSFADRHVGTGKVVSVGGVVVNDGNGGANYSVTYADNVNGTITQRPLSTWTGSAGNGLWSSPGNWDALPDASNVLGVSIPAGANVSYDLPGATMLKTISSDGSFGIASGTLSLAGSASTRGYSQSGGLLAGGGSLLVTEQFTQGGGAIDLAGAVDIRQGSGNLQAGSIRAGSIALEAVAGSIGQGGPLVTAGLLSASARDGIVLDHAGNQVAAFEGSTTGAGPLQFTNVGALEVRGLSTAQGDITLVNTGAIVTTGPVTADGKVAITANSPLTVGTPGIAATGDIVLVASNLTSAGNMTLEGDVVSSAGAVHLTAGADLLQKALVQGEKGVTATAEGAIVFGPNARTAGSPISYTAGGVPVTPPTGQTAGPMQEAVQLQNQQLASDLDRLETFAALFVDEAEDQRKRRLLDGIVVKEAQCRR